MPNNIPYHEYESNPPLKKYFGQADYAELVKYKEAVLWLYSQKGHDLCHENIKDLFKMCGLPPKELGLPPREEFRERCMTYEEEIYTDEAKIGQINRYSIPKLLKQLKKNCGKAVETIDNMTESKDGY